LRFRNSEAVEELLLFVLSLKLGDAVLVLDGLTDFSKQLHVYFNPCFQKMFFVTSQQVFLGDVDKSISRQSFKCFPWKLEDYNQVCSYDLFWNNMGHDIFDLACMKEVSADDKESVVQQRKEMIHRKFFFAGYSARWMFRESESTLPETVEAYASKVKDVDKYLFGTSWDKTDDAVNHILVQMNAKSCFVLVSVFAAKILASISRDSSEIADYIRKCAIAVKDARMMGCAYEVHIKNLVKTKIGSSVEVTDKRTRQHQWAVSSVTYYQSLSDVELPGSRLSSGDWFFPCSFMQGGFDMLQLLAVDGGYKVRFVQITIAEAHSFKQDYFVDVLSVLRKVVLKDFELVEVEFVGLVPEYRLQGFKYDPKIRDPRGNTSGKIHQTILHCTIPNDVNWLQNPNR
jgi:hypothetical protein